MRYQLEIPIDQPRARVVDLFLDPANLRKWQPDLVSFEPVGPQAPREVGARSKQVHRMGRREVEILETITEHDHPEKFSAIYEADKVWNLVENRFLDVGDGTTRWILDTEFKCSGLVGIMAFFLPGLFKKQTLTFMKRFKEFAENASG